MAENFLPFSREELFEGMPGKRASSLLLAIEGRTALLVSRAREATALYLTVEAVEGREIFQGIGRRSLAARAEHDEQP